MMPEMDKVGIRSEMKLVDAPCATWKKTGARRTPAAMATRSKWYCTAASPRSASSRPASTCWTITTTWKRLLRTTWRKLGGSIAGQVREADAPPPAAPDAAPAPVTRLLAEHLSRPLPEVLRDINKFSDNTLARALFLTLGSLEADPVLGSRALAADIGQASTPMRAETAIRAWLQNHRIDGNGLVFDNGSGLSRIERATPAQLAGVLQAGLKSLWTPEFMSSLPIAATDGTMRKRLKDGPAAMRARIKTGSLNGVIAIAGYVPDANNQLCVVVAILNDEHVANGAGRTVLDGVIDWVARSRQP